VHNFLSCRKIAQLIILKNLIQVSDSDSHQFLYNLRCCDLNFRCSWYHQGHQRSRTQHGGKHAQLIIQSILWHYCWSELEQYILQRFDWRHSICQWWQPGGRQWQPGEIHHLFRPSAPPHIHTSLMGSLWQQQSTEIERNTVSQQHTTK